MRLFTFYKQLDSMDCGPTCLRMVAKHYGKSYSLPFLREKCYIDKVGVSLKGISEAAKLLGLTALAVKKPYIKQGKRIFSFWINNNVSENTNTIMRTCLIVSLILIFLMKISGQTSYDLYEENLRLADSLRHDSHFEEGSKFYEKALIIKPNESVTDYFKFAECLFYSKGLQASINKIQESIEVGGANLESIHNYKGFDDIRCSALFKDLILRHNSHRILFFSNNADKIDELLAIESLNARDQFLRSLKVQLEDSESDAFSALKAYKRARGEKDVFSELDIQNIEKLMFVSDEMLKHDLIEFVEKYGYSDRCWNLLWHRRDEIDDGDSDFWAFMKPVIDSEIEKGNLSKNWWGKFNWINDFFDNQ